MTPFFPLPRHMQEILHIHLAGLILILGLGIILAKGMQETGQADGGIGSDKRRSQWSG